MKGNKNRHGDDRVKQIEALGRYLDFPEKDMELLILA